MVVFGKNVPTYSALCLLAAPDWFKLLGLGSLRSRKIYTHTASFSWLPRIEGGKKKQKGCIQVQNTVAHSSPDARTSRDGRGYVPRLFSMKTQVIYLMLSPAVVSNNF